MPGGKPSAGRASWLELFSVILILAALAIAYTWPLACNPAGITTVGPNDNDARLVLYSVFWGARALTSSPLELHNANIFYPEKYSYTYSVILLSHSLLAIPLLWLTYNPGLIYNFLLLASILIGGAGMFALAKELTSNNAAALAGAVIFIFNPAHFGRYAQLQLFSDHWIPWFALFLILWLRSFEKAGTVGWGRPVAAALFFSLNALSGAHIAVFGACVGAAAVAHYAFRAKLWREGRFWIGLGVMSLVCALLLGPVFWPYLIVEERLSTQRVADFSVLSAGSAGPVELFTAGSKFYRWLDEGIGWPSRALGGFARSMLFPGVVALALGVIGIAGRTAGGRKPEKSRFKAAAWALDVLLLWAAWAALMQAIGSLDYQPFTLVPAPPAWALAGIAVVAAALRLTVLKGSPHALAALAGHLGRADRDGGDRALWLTVWLLAMAATLGPAAGLYHIIGRLPVLRMIRVPSRFALLASFALAVLAAYGVAAIVRRLRSRSLVAVALVALALLFLVESFYAPLPVHRFDPAPPLLYRWLGEQEGQFAVVEFPLGPKDWPVFARQVYYSIYHWKRLLVGYSGFQSEENVRLLRRIGSSFPSDECLDELKGLTVRYAIVLEDRMAEQKLNRIEASPRLHPVRSFEGNIRVYEIR